CCGEAGSGRRLGLVGHGLRERQVLGPLSASGAPEQVVLLVRRYRCRGCEAIVMSMPRGVLRRMPSPIDTTFARTSSLARLPRPPQFRFSSRCSTSRADPTSHLLLSTPTLADPDASRGPSSWPASSPSTSPDAPAAVV